MKLFISHSMIDADFVKILVQQLRHHEHDVVLADEIWSSGRIDSHISSSIRSADLIVAILRNNNVYYEVGLAMGAGRSVLIVAPEEEQLPFDLASVPYVQLTGDILRDSKLITRLVDAMSINQSPRPVTKATAEETLKLIAQQPNALEALSGSEFERLIWDLFKERGYRVDTQRYPQNSGVDIAIRGAKGGETLLIELKKLSGQSLVSIEPVTRLISVLKSEGASVGMIITTSRFTKAAEALSAENNIRLRTLNEVLAANTYDELIQPNQVN